MNEIGSAMLPWEHLLLLRGLAAGDRNGGPIRLAMLLYEQLCKGEVHPDNIFAYTEQS